jgi:hypothetical protein
LLNPVDVPITLSPQEDEEEEVRRFAGTINDVKVYYEFVAKNKPGDIVTTTGETVTPLRKKDGGLVTGPGTGRSDSILSWLSNKEYVIDAFTTRYFGSGFFAALQTIAKRGRGTSFGFKGGIPALASGGYVGDVVAKAGTKDKVATFNLGGRSFDFAAPEETINELGRTIRVLSTKRSRVR